MKTAPEAVYTLQVFAGNAVTMARNMGGFIEEMNSQGGLQAVIADYFNSDPPPSFSADDAVAAYAVLSALASAVNDVPVDKAKLLKVSR
jgi:hypothetical protein